MDTSAEYIEMCRQAEEIQFNWHPDTGDIFIPLPFDSRVVVLTEHLEIIRGKTTGRFVQIAFPKGFYPNIESKKLTSECVWLPRQDQLQEMVGDYPENYLDFVNWNETYYPIIVFPLQKQQMHPFSHFNSMEQLWLAYVMWRKFHKVWNGEDWVKS